jgi:2-polyprenyl-3-methyl-5-hydroxy-6-metoxy-1,4-benzoquinol methylase
MTRQEHWNQVYQTKGPEDLSWTQTRPDLSLDLISAAGLTKDAGIIDVGGGTSILVDSLIADGYTRLAVLDVSRAALEKSRARLSTMAQAVEWFETDVTSFIPPHQFALWHDRAVFHFLIDPADRNAYVAVLRQALQPGGTAIIATFATDGPPKCSGLDVMRHDEQSIAAELGNEFRLLEVCRETHLTPWNSEQRFIYFRFKRLL